MDTKIEIGCSKYYHTVITKRCIYVAKSASNVYDSWIFYNIIYLPFERAIIGMGSLMLFESFLAVKKLGAVIDIAFEKHGWW